MRFRRTADYVLRAIAESDHFIDARKYDVQNEYKLRFAEIYRVKFGPWAYNGLSNKEIPIVQKALRYGKTGFLDAEYEQWRRERWPVMQAKQMAARKARREAKKKERARYIPLPIYGIKVRINNEFEAVISHFRIRIVSVGKPLITISVNGGWPLNKEYGVMNNSFVAVDPKQRKQLDRNLAQIRIFAEHIGNYWIKSSCLKKIEKLEADLKMQRDKLNKAVRNLSNPNKATREAIEKVISPEHKYDPLTFELVEKITLDNYMRRYSRHELIGL